MRLRPPCRPRYPRAGDAASCGALLKGNNVRCVAISRRTWAVSFYDLGRFCNCPTGRPRCEDAATTGIVPDSSLRAAQHFEGLKYLTKADYGNSVACLFCKIHKLISTIEIRNRIIAGL